MSIEILVVQEFKLFEEKNFKIFQIVKELYLYSPVASAKHDKIISA